MLTFTLRLFAVIVLSMSVSLFAQEPDTEPESSDSVETPTQPAEAQPTPPPSRDDPFDYESSEEISEDLSVSFPVDI